MIDLSADFRLQNVDVYEEWYKVTHPAPHLLAEAVYGLTEFARGDLPGARLVANPGCYTTTALLALQPLMQAASAGTAAAGLVRPADSAVAGSAAAREAGAAEAGLAHPEGSVVVLLPRGRRRVPYQRRDRRRRYPRSRENAPSPPPVSRLRSQQ